jgi:hypothetical protein
MISTVVVLADGRELRSAASGVPLIPPALKSRSAVAMWSTNIRSDLPYVEDSIARAAL